MAMLMWKKPESQVELAQLGLCWLEPVCQAVSACQVEQAYLLVLD